MRKKAVLLLAGLLVWTFIPVVAGQQLSGKARIVLNVTDETGARVDEATVQLWLNNTRLIETGTTVMGVWVSSPLALGYNYTVYVSTQLASSNHTLHVGEAIDYSVQIMIRQPHPARISLLKVEQQPSNATPGGRLEVKLHLTNVGGLVARDVVLTIRPDALFAIYNQSNVRNLEDISPGEVRVVSFDALVSASATEGDYTWQYELQYVDASLRSWSAAGGFSVRVSGYSARSVLTISMKGDLTMEPDSRELLGITLRNVGALPAARGTLFLSLEGPIIIANGSTVHAFDTLPPEGEVAVNIGLVALPDAKTSVSKLNYTLVYEDPRMGVVNVRGFAEIRVQARPLIKISSITVGQSPLRPGTEASMRVVISNVGQETAFDVYVAIIQGREFVTPAGIYLGIIPPRLSQNVTFSVLVPYAAKIEERVLSINVSYTDAKKIGNSEIIQVPLPIEPYSQSVLKVTNVLTDPPVMAQGLTGTLTIFVKNVGKTPISDATVRISGGDDILSSTTFTIGGIAPDQTATVVVGVNVRPEIEPSRRLLAITMEYSDPAGVTYVTKTFYEMIIYLGFTLYSSETWVLIGMGVLGSLMFLIFLKQMRWLK